MACILYIAYVQFARNSPRYRYFLCVVWRKREKKKTSSIILIVRLDWAHSHKITRNRPLFFSVRLLFLLFSFLVFPISIPCSTWKTAQPIYAIYLKSKKKKKERNICVICAYTLWDCEGFVFFLLFVQIAIASFSMHITDNEQITIKTTKKNVISRNKTKKNATGVTDVIVENWKGFFFFYWKISL